MKIKIHFLVILFFVSLFLSGQNHSDNTFVNRRNILRSAFQGQAILYSGLLSTSAGLDKNFYYYTGIGGNDMVLLMGNSSNGDMLFVDPADLPMSLPDMAAKSGISLIFGRDQLSAVLTSLSALNWNFFFPMRYTPSDPEYLYPDCLAIERILQSLPYCSKHELKWDIFAMRMIKDNDEIASIRRSVDVTGEGIMAGIAAVRPGLIENEVQRIIEDRFRTGGSERNSFPPIIGSGPNSLILHYMENTRRMEAGEVVVMDVGAEYEWYAGDITRTVPVSGIFTPRQREVYEVLLEAQKRAIAECQPGADIDDVHIAAMNYATEQGYGDYFNYSGWNHGTSHSLGLDVHDPMSDWILQPGMVITVEPGIYIPDENLGLRIEDDVLITQSGYVVLSAAVPKEAEDIEELMKYGVAPELENIHRKYTEIVSDRSRDGR